MKIIQHEKRRVLATQTTKERPHCIEQDSASRLRRSFDWRRNVRKGPKQLGQQPRNLARIVAQRLAYHHRVSYLRENRLENFYERDEGNRILAIVTTSGEYRHAASRSFGAQLSGNPRLADTGCPVNQNSSAGIGERPLQAAGQNRKFVFSSDKCRCLCGCGKEILAADRDRRSRSHCAGLWRRILEGESPVQLDVRRGKVTAKRARPYRRLEQSSERLISLRDFLDGASDRARDIQPCSLGGGACTAVSMMDIEGAHQFPGQKPDLGIAFFGAIHLASLLQIRSS